MEGTVEGVSSGAAESQRGDGTEATPAGFTQSLWSNYLGNSREVSGNIDT